MPFNTSQKRFQMIFILICSLTFFILLYLFLGTQTHYSVLLKTQLARVKIGFAAKSVRICCLILTSPDSILTRARAAHETWAPRCDRHFFLTENFNDSNFTTVHARFIEQLPLLFMGNDSSGRKHLTKKVNTAFLFLHQHHLHDFDWFVKADDDTYILVENLRAFLAKQNTTEPVTFGYNFKVMHVQRYPTHQMCRCFRLLSKVVITPVEQRMYSVRNR